MIACANLVPRLESHYVWQGKLECAAEVLLVIKTRKTKLVALEKLITAEHPYDAPEFIVLSPASGNEKYLNWLATSCR